MSSSTKQSQIPDLNLLYSDYLRIVTADALINAQYVEKVLKGVCVILAPNGVRIELEDFLSGDPQRTRYTLGQISRAVQSTNLFTSDFSTRLDTYVQRRNRLVHGLFADHFQSRTEIQPQSAQSQEYVEYCGWLIEEGARLIEVGFGIFFALGVRLRASGMLDPQFQQVLDSFEEYRELGFSTMHAEYRRAWEAQVKPDAGNRQ